MVVKRIAFLFLLLSIVFTLYAETDKTEENLVENLHFKDKLIAKINSLNVADEFKVILLAMSPVLELRLSIPMGIKVYNIPVIWVFILSLFGNIIPVILIILFFDAVTIILYKVPYLGRFMDNFFSKIKKRGKVIEKYEELGLILFVAIPLPGTGGWTGALIAYLFRLRFWHSLFFIFLGLISAAIIVTLLTLLGWLGALIAALSILSFITWKILKSNNKNLHKQ